MKQKSTAGGRPKKVMTAVLLLFLALSATLRAQVTETMHASFEATWEATVAELSNKTQIQTMAKSSGFIQTIERPIAAGLGSLTKMKDSAIGPRGIVQLYDVRSAYVTVFVRKQSLSRTRVEVTVHYRTLSHGVAGAENSLDWRSRGRVEREFLAAIRHRLMR
jgi:hypothetical protein